MPREIQLPEFTQLTNIMKSESEVTQSCLTVHNPLDCSLPGSSLVHGIFQARVLEWGAIAFSYYVDLNQRVQICDNEKELSKGRER